MATKWKELVTMLIKSSQTCWFPENNRNFCYVIREKQWEQCSSRISKIFNFWMCDVIKVGFIISLQLRLSCSLDRILIYMSNIWRKRVVEIKCSYNCRSVLIFDTELSKLNVKYLKINKNVLQLNKNYSIYTQIQLQMYVINIALCDLFIYSPKRSILISIQRDKMFLANVVPCIEQFYFNHYLSRLYLIYS